MRINITTLIADADTLEDAICIVAGALKCSFREASIYLELLKKGYKA